HPAHKARLQSELADQLGNLRPAAVHDDRVDPDQVEQHDFLRKALAQFFGLHRVAAAFDHHRLAAKTPNVGQRFDEHAGSIVDGLFHALATSPKKKIKTVLSAPRNPSPARPLEPV